MALRNWRCPFLQKKKRDHMIDESRDQMVVVNSIHTLLKLVAIILAKVEVKTFFDHMINDIYIYNI